jgi:hypothetical protein
MPTSWSLERPVSQRADCGAWHSPCYRGVGITTVAMRIVSVEHLAISVRERCVDDGSYGYAPPCGEALDVSLYPEQCAWIADRDWSG